MLFVQRRGDLEEIPTRIRINLVEAGLLGCEPRQGGGGVADERTRGVPLAARTDGFAGSRFFLKEIDHVVGAGLFANLPAKACYYGIWILVKHALLGHALFVTVSLRCVGW